MVAQSLLLLLVLAADPEPTAPATDEKPAETAEIKRAERQICQRVTVLGSRLASKVTCGTRAEWAIRERESKHFIDKAREGGRNVYAR